MKQLGFYSIALFATCLMVFSISSCSDDPMPLPTVNFIADVDGYEVAIVVETTDATTYAWEYGDGSTSTEDGNHSHTYAQSGEYTIKVTVTNESGSATKNIKVNIAASMTELLAGAASGGKTWVLDATATTAVQKINATFDPLWAALPAGALAAFELEAEYDNEYTFKPNGSYGIAAKNGAVLTGILFSLVNELEIVVEPNSGAGGLTGAAFTDINAGQFTLHENTNLTLSVANEDYPAGTNNGGITEVTFANADYLTFSSGYHFGVRDFTTTVLIRSLTKDKMEVTFFLSTLDPTTYPETLGLPSIAISTALKVKP